MHLKRKLVAFMIALLMAVTLSAQSGGPVTLQSAAAGKVAYTFNGPGASSGDSIRRLKVKKTPKARG